MEITTTSVRQRLQDVISRNLFSIDRLATETGLDANQLDRFLNGSSDEELFGEELARLHMLVAHLIPEDTVLPIHHAQKVARKLAEGQVALFVGAGISDLCLVRDGTAKRMSLWGQLAETIDITDTPGSFKDPLDLFDAVVCDQERGILDAAVREELDDRGYILSFTHEALN